MKTAPHRLLIVDDSALIRKALCRIFDGYPQIQVVGQAADGREALKLLTEFSPDVVTLDVKMPVMDGLTTLKHLMIQRPTPTVMVSAFTKEGAVTTFDALKFGAVDFVPKPSRFADSVLADQNEAIVRKVLTAADVQIDAVQVVRTKPLASPRPDETPLAANLLVAMGAAEGGYGSLLKIIPCIDRQQSVATIVVLYEAAPYVDAFVRYLGVYSGMTVERTLDGTPVYGGACYIASAEEYVTVEPNGSGLRLRVHPAPFEERRGAVNMLMFSMAEALGQQTVGVVLSGIGQDGAEGIEEIQRQGGRAIVQNPVGSLHKEMPLAAIEKLQVDDTVISDTQIASAINQLAQCG